MAASLIDGPLRRVGTAENCQVSAERSRRSPTSLTPKFHAGRFSDHPHFPLSSRSPEATHEATTRGSRSCGDLPVHPGAERGAADRLHPPGRSESRPVLSRLGRDARAADEHAREPDRVRVDQVAIRAAGARAGRAGLLPELQPDDRHARTGRTRSRSSRAARRRPSRMARVSRRNGSARPARRADRSCSPGTASRRRTSITTTIARRTSIKGAIVLVVDHEPGERDPNSPFDGVVTSDAGGALRKAQAAQAKGAAGILYVSDVHNHPGAAGNARRQLLAAAAVAARHLLAGRMDGEHPHSGGADLGGRWPARLVKGTGQDARGPVEVGGYAARRQPRSALPGVEVRSDHSGQSTADCPIATCSRRSKAATRGSKTSGS